MLLIGNEPRVSFATQLSAEQVSLQKRVQPPGVKVASQGWFFKNLRLIKNLQSGGKGKVLMESSTRR